MTPSPLPVSAVLTHHWLVRRRGGEKVLEALAELVRPDAPLFTLVHDSNGYANPLGSGGSGAARRIVTSFLQRVPGARRHYPMLLPLMPSAARSMRLPPAELVLCSDAAIAKAMRPHEGSRVVCYCHSPMRYVWEPEISRQYAATLPAVLRPLWPLVCGRVREADRDAARRVDQFVANSAAVAERIRRCYDRPSVVVHPPVELPASPGPVEREDFYLCVGYHVAYKRLSLAVQTCERIGVPLVVIGEGPDVEVLRRRDHPRVRWLGFQPDEVVRDHYSRARALLFPGEEDFGIVPVEAMAHGCPLIAFGRGGTCETVIDGRTGILFEQQDADHLIAAIRRAEQTRFDPTEMFEQARRFGRERFLNEMRRVLDESLA